ncbi:MAG: hypothetical protein ACRYG4_20900, partial [Janthinobacterium lividum]
MGAGAGAGGAAVARCSIRARSSIRDRVSLATQSASPQWSRRDWNFGRPRSARSRLRASPLSMIRENDAAIASSSAPSAGLAQTIASTRDRPLQLRAAGGGAGCGAGGATASAGADVAGRGALCLSTGFAGGASFACMVRGAGAGVGAEPAAEGGEIG